MATCSSAWLLAFDADGDGGRGKIAFTTDLAEAMRFDSLRALMACWKTQSTVIPLRPDGKPNRPLTAFTISAEQLPCR